MKGFFHKFQMMQKRVRIRENSMVDDAIQVDLKVKSDPHIAAVVELM